MSSNVPRVVQGFFVGGPPRLSTLPAAPRGSAGLARGSNPSGHAPRTAGGQPRAAHISSSAPGISPTVVIQPHSHGKAFQLPDRFAAVNAGPGQPLPAPVLAKMESA